MFHHLSHPSWLRRVLGLGPQARQSPRQGLSLCPPVAQAGLTPVPAVHLVAGKSRAVTLWWLFYQRLFTIESRRTLRLHRELLQPGHHRNLLSSRLTHGYLSQL